MSCFRFRLLRTMAQGTFFIASAVLFMQSASAEAPYPMVTPNSSFISPFPITASDFVATVLPTGVDDYDNIQYALNQLAEKPGARLNLNGHYYTRYMLQGLNFDGTIVGSMPTELTAGKPGERMQLLNAADRIVYNPTGWPDLLVFRQTSANATAINVTIENVTFSGSEGAGYTGALNFGFVNPHINLGVRGLVSLLGIHPNNSVLDFPVTLNGTTANSLGFPNPMLLRVWSNPLESGTLFEPGDDYTLDLAAGTIARNPSGAIPDGVTVYCSYDNANNWNDVPHIEAEFRNCYFRGALVEGPDDEIHANVGGAGILVWGDTAHGIEHIDDVFHNAVITELQEYANLRYGRESPFSLRTVGKSVPLNLNLLVEGCRFEDLSLGVWTDHVEGATPGPYNFLSGSVPLSTVTIRSCTGNRVGTDNHGYYFSFHDTTSATCYASIDNELTDCAGFVAIGAGQEYGESRLEGWAGSSADWVIADNDVQIGHWTVILGALEVTRTHDFFARQSPISASDSINISGNTIEFLPVPGAGQGGRRIVGINIDRHLDVAVLNNVFINPRPNASEAVLVLSETATITNNDFSSWQKRRGVADICLGADSHDCYVEALNPTDLIKNDGVNNTIIGGIQLPK